MLVTVGGHPAGTLKMAVVHKARSVGFDSGIEFEDDLNYFAPVCTFLSGVKYP